jgi:hypothetical protein|tara:strand:+ start:4500 stop:4754 length:255 start_codon:yes stop_codon:yes gene_type:complete
MVYVYNVKQNQSQGTEKNSVASNVVKSITNHQKREEPIKSQNVIGVVKFLFQKVAHHNFTVPKNVIANSNMKRTEDSAERMCPE